MTKTILVVDDNKELKENLVEFLSHAGYEVLSASSGTQSLDLLLGCKPDLIITDIVMPGMNGFELIEAIRCKKCQQEIPIIAFSAAPPQLTTGGNSLGGANAFLRKPASMEEMLELIEKLLGNKDQD